MCLQIGNVVMVSCGSELNKTNDFIYLFLFALFSAEDIKLNSSVFHWPDNINGVFDLSQNRLLSRRERAEEELKKKIAAFEEKLLEYNKEIETFRKKEVCTNTISLGVVCLSKFVKDSG